MAGCVSHGTRTCTAGWHAGVMLTTSTLTDTAGDPFDLIVDREAGWAVLSLPPGVSGVGVDARVVAAMAAELARSPALRTALERAVRGL